MSKFKKALSIGAIILTCSFIIATLPYYKTVIYKLPAPKPFAGDTFYNPYQTTGKQWIKANFHAHSIMHFGLANGDNTPEEMFAVYDSMHYDLACISNYNNILPNNYPKRYYLPAYEHGLNTGAIHRLVLNNQQADRFDFPFYQNVHHKQQVLNLQKSEDNLVGLTHPVFKTGYSKSDLKYLTNYDLFEGISVRATSIERWDEALSHGHPVWVIGNDDAHNTRFGTCGVCWTMVNVDSLTKDEVLKNLKSGNSYATRGWVGQEMNRIKGVSIDSNRYVLELEKKSDSIILKSDFGKTVAVATHANKISYTIQETDTYLRAELFDTEPWNNYTKTYLNPVVRTVDGTCPSNRATLEINKTKTWLWRMGFLIFQFVLGVAIVYLLKMILKIK
ncbi:MAG TPA: hypothetical protein DCQ26_07850 [Marinilabiliales bacterium]|nr:MAG: hypothetical protein A2W84_17180 [Bacteroidetes bacterium GWC2_40_13]OFX73391.1 MAG: hypothetical protein A2W96_03755 [Bacteroidetes bacterium GWD2_40_43]OFX94741.1 MAG: hypothetical protein A2W97_18660 [Bacteroidetes bacterium GWE2_40_63]OFY24729.1 MAG: hypothetical protein A2W88_16650 [Bacteroidetes bacterium GWF2_40_13]OFZ24033.1 MAG: hypothetical protein A2437_02615 [Bacteroidetes bacterium RIFOXYC2_FULL_40_12]HAM98512.1 hypothetical protein [Marinilabiliales bacterium]